MHRPSACATRLTRTNCAMSSRRFCDVPRPPADRRRNRPGAVCRLRRVVARPLHSSLCEDARMERLLCHPGGRAVPHQGYRRAVRHGLRLPFADPVSRSGRRPECRSGQEGKGGGRQMAAHGAVALSRVWPRPGSGTCRPPEIRRPAHPTSMHPKRTSPRPEASACPPKTGRTRDRQRKHKRLDRQPSAVSEGRALWPAPNCDGDIVSELRRTWPSRSTGLARPRDFPRDTRPSHRASSIDLPNEELRLSIRLNRPPAGQAATDRGMLETALSMRAAGCTLYCAGGR